MLSYFKNIGEVKKQLIKFILIGMLAVLVDLGVYYLLLNILPETFIATIPNEITAKFLSFLCGSFVTYNLNKYWTWRQKDRSNKRFVHFILLYGFSLVLNVASNTFVLYLLREISLFENVPFKYFIAFVFATGISAGFNFTGQKFWVFKSKNEK